MTWVIFKQWQHDYIPRAQQGFLFPGLLLINQIPILNLKQYSRIIKKKIPSSLHTWMKHDMKL